VMRDAGSRHETPSWPDECVDARTAGAKAAARQVLVLQPSFSSTTSSAYCNSIGDHARAGCSAERSMA
jgi:hypothetical protein